MQNAGTIAHKQLPSLTYASSHFRSIANARQSPPKLTFACTRHALPIVIVFLKIASLASSIQYVWDVWIVIHLKLSMADVYCWRKVLGVCEHMMVGYSMLGSKVVLVNDCRCWLISFWKLSQIEVVECCFWPWQSLGTPFFAILLSLAFRLLSTLK